MFKDGKWYIREEVRKYVYRFDTSVNRGRALQFLKIRTQCEGEQASPQRNLSGMRDHLIVAMAWKTSSADWVLDLVPWRNFRCQKIDSVKAICIPGVETHLSANRVPQPA
jgi:hypothetical protein